MLRRFLAIVVSCILSVSVFAQPLTQAQIIEESRRLDQKWQFNDNKLLYVDTFSQKLYVLSDFSVQYVYSISSSKYGIGNKSGSLRTPTGMHKIIESYGKNAPLGTIFKARVNTGKQYDFSQKRRGKQKDYVLSRVLRLSGLEKGINKGNRIDSFKRYIYLHGTNEESKIGKPSSRGCIRMNNLDIIDLYEYVQIGDFVYIRG